MTPEQIALVRQSYADIRPSGAFAESFYARLFALDPDLKALFKDDIRSQAKKLVATFNILVSSLDMLDLIDAQIRELARKHVSARVKIEDYETMRIAFLDTIADHLGAQFSPHVRSAWDAAYRDFAGRMVRHSFGAHVEAPFPPRGTTEVAAE